MPVSKADYTKYPLTTGAKPAYSARVQSFHLAIAHLRCFDARLTRPSGEIKFNWWDRDNEFIKGIRLPGSLNTLAFSGLCFTKSHRTWAA